MSYLTVAQNHMLILNLNTIHEYTMTSVGTIDSQRKPRTIISFHIGQAGVQMGLAMWDLLSEEHGLGYKGYKNSCETCLERSAQVMFHQWSGPKYTARCCFIDSDVCTLAHLKNGPQRDLYQSDYIMCTKAESGGLYSRGYSAVADEVLERSLSWVNRMAEGSDYPCGFLFTHSMGGGTGSGVTARLMNVFKKEFPKASQVQLAVMPSQKINSNTSVIVEPYNISLLLKDTFEDNRAVILVDNEGLFRVANTAGGVEQPNYRTINNIVAHVLSALTAGTRFNGTQTVRFSDIETNIVATRRLRFATSSFAPVVGPMAVKHESMDVTGVVNNLFSPRMQHFTADFYTSKSITTAVLYRSRIDSAGEVRARLDQLIGKNVLKFVPWVPTAIKVGMVDWSPQFLPFGEFMGGPRSATLLSNSTALMRPFDSVHECVSAMLKKRAFQHWYTLSGMFADELSVAKESLSELIDEYINTSLPRSCSI